jgi:hypothetical protein
MDAPHPDSELILKLGGPSKVAEMLKLRRPDGQRRVHNWLSRGIPAQVKVDHPDLFMPGLVRAESVDTQPATAG